MHLLFCACSLYQPVHVAPQAAKTTSNLPFTESILHDFSRQFPELWQTALSKVDPMSPALSSILSSEKNKFREQKVLVSVYQKPKTHPRFIDLRGIKPAGKLWQAELEAVGEHALDPKDYHPSKIREQLSQHTMLVREIERLSTVKEPSQVEMTQLKQAIQSQSQHGANLDSPLKVMNYLIGSTSPLPRFSRVYEQKKDKQRQLALLTARIELLLADDLLHYARELNRGNTKPIDLQLQWRKEDQQINASIHKKSEQKEAQAANTTKSSSAGKTNGVIDPLDLFVTLGRQAYIEKQLENDLVSVEDKKSLSALLLDLPPAHPQYALLKIARNHYRKIVQQGGWQRIEPSLNLRYGKKHPKIKALKLRLQAEGYYSDGIDAVFDSGLKNAIRSFQQTHQLIDNGIPDRQFWQQLNEPASKRLLTIETALKRWQENPIGKSAYYVWINIPDFHLEVMKDNKPLLRQKVVVGKAGGQKCDEETERKVLAYATPIQSARIQSLVFSPYWKVTRTIKETELDPERSKDSLFYEKNGYEIMKPNTRGEWVRQLPGPANPLGFIKFLFPNPFETYLHDTSDKGLFDRPLRAFSHGCIRVDEPWNLAKVLLTEDKQWKQTDFEALNKDWRAMDFEPLRTEWDPDLYQKLVEKAAKLETQVFLRKPIPIHVVYYTARVDEQGRVHFLNDLYQIEETRPKSNLGRHCIPESKAARQRFLAIPSRLTALEKTAQALVPKVNQALLQAQSLDAQGTWAIRRLIKEAKKTSNFEEHYQSFAKNILEDYQKWAVVAAKVKRQEWPEALMENVIRLDRLMSGFEEMIRQANRLVDELSRLQKSITSPPKNN